MEKWVVSAKKADFQKISQQFHIDPVTARLIRNREVEGEEAIREYLNGGLELLGDPFATVSYTHLTLPTNSRV